MQIQAAVLHSPNMPFKLETLTLDAPRAGEVLVKVAACGVCHSDYHVANGATRHPLPVVCGHEAAGRVIATGSGVTGLDVGDHVLFSWSPACGACFYCLHGRPNLCETYTLPIWAGTMLDGTTRLHHNDAPVYVYCGLGAFADYTVVPAASCVSIRRDVALAVVSLIGCAVATGLGAVWYTAGVRLGESVVVFGCGGVGLNIIQGAALCGAYPIIAVDRNETKMALARVFGATHTLLTAPNDDDNHLLREIRTVTGGRGADYAFEAVGMPGLQELALAATRPGGMAVLAGLTPMGSASNLAGALITRQEKTIKGSYYGGVHPQRDFPFFLELYLQGKLKLNELISREYRLEQINEAFETMLSGEMARGIILF